MAAWSGYAAAKWSTESRVGLAAASTARTKASRANLDAIDRRNFDASTFNAWFSAFTVHNKRAMARRARASGFVPGGYLFLEAGDGAGQAEFFHSKAGNMAGFAIAVDVEPTTGSRPGPPAAHACVARLRQLYPSHPIIGYIPHWYWDDQSTRFVDVLWASNYVTGSGTLAQLYAHVRPRQWAAYGGRSPALL